MSVKVSTESDNLSVRDARQELPEIDREHVARGLQAL
jgi:hypothetical protein